MYFSSGGIIDMGLLDRLFHQQPKPGRARPTTQATFEEDVLSSPLPVVVDFWATWCSPCKVMGGLLDEVAPRYVGKIEFFKLNIDQNPEIAAEYGVRSIPTLIFFHQSSPVDRITGLLPLIPLTERLNRLARLADMTARETPSAGGQPDQES